MINKNWARWIFASVSKSFQDRADQIPFYVEGTDKEGRRKDKDYFEFRMNGPFIDEVSARWYFIVFDVNILVCSLKDKRDFHRIHQNVGIATTMFQGSIPIRKYGDGPDDDQSLVDCALLETEGRYGGIYVNHHGQFEPTLPVLQATVEGSYRLTLQL